MSVLPLVYAPNEIFKTKAEPVKAVNDEIRSLIDQMFNTIYMEQAVGLGANMVGILKRIAVVDMQPKGTKMPFVFINPEITWRSDEMQTFKEGSLCFPGITADITRPKAIKLSFQDYEGNKQELDADGFFATVIQHECDYLDGKVFLDYLSKMKRDLLMAKMQKHMRMYPPHVHSASCKH
jgi:peptide deformylase